MKLTEAIIKIISSLKFQSKCCAGSSCRIGEQTEDEVIETENKKI